MQGVFQHLRGVSNAVSGYAGGTRAEADYRTVSGGGTGHAEAVSVTYDPAAIRRHVAERFDYLTLAARLDAAYDAALSPACRRVG